MKSILNGTRLILVEGLPGTGKTTDSAFLHVQLRRSGVSVRWIHEVASPHPTSFFHEACLTRGEYEALLRAYPEAAELLGRIADIRERTVSIDLLAIEWFHKNAISNALLHELKCCDIWEFPLDRYCEAALDKWSSFVRGIQNEPDTVYIVDSSLFQFQIFRFLLKNAEADALAAFIGRLCDVIRPLNPVMVYLFRERVEDSIAFLEKTRGMAFLESIRSRDAAQPYYQGKPAGAEGFRMFLREYDAMLRRLAATTGFPTLAVDVTRQDWDDYEQRLLAFLNMPRIEAPAVQPPQGCFVSPEGLRLTVEGCVLIESDGRRSALTAASASEFCVEGLPVVLRFDGADRLIIDGVAIHERWMVTGVTWLREKT